MPFHLKKPFLQRDVNYQRAFFICIVFFLFFHEPDRKYIYIYIYVVKKRKQQLKQGSRLKEKYFFFLPIHWCMFGGFLPERIHYLGSSFTLFSGQTFY